MKLYKEFWEDFEEGDGLGKEQEDFIELNEVKLVEKTITVKSWEHV